MRDCPQLRDGGPCVPNPHHPTRCARCSGSLDPAPTDQGAEGLVRGEWPMKFPVCPNCGSRKWDHGFGCRECANCGLAYKTPRLIRLSPVPADEGETGDE